MEDMEYDFISVDNFINMKLGSGFLAIYLAYLNIFLTSFSP